MPAKVNIKIKNSTAEMIIELANRLDLPTYEIENEFYMFWNDMSIMFTYNLGYGMCIDSLGRFLLNVRSVTSRTKKIEKQILASYRRIAYYESIEKIKDVSTKKLMIVFQIGQYITKIILLDCSLKAYEKEVREQYPRKYKPVRIYLDEYIARLEKHLGISLSTFPVHISNPIQEVFVRRMQSKGFLQNPMVHKDPKV